MQLKYILTIIGISLFLICFLLFIITTARTRRRDALLWEGLERMYADKNLATIDYDFAIYDEELEKLLNSCKAQDGQLTIEDLIGVKSSVSDESIFQNIDTDGLEEITGNYIPDNS